MCSKYGLILCYSVKQKFKDVGGFQGNNQDLFLTIKAFTIKWLLRRRQHLKPEGVHNLGNSVIF